MGLLEKARNEVSASLNLKLQSERVSMETNESILTRSIVGLDERKVLGKMSSLRVDYDT